MPTTQENVERILRRVPNESPETILEVLDEVQTIVYSQDCAQTLKITSTGMPPYLATTDNQFEYDGPADCRRTVSIFTTSNSTRRVNTRPVGPSKVYYFKNKGYVEVACSTVDALVSAGTLAKIRFIENPGTTTQNYYHLYYVKPTPLSDVGIQMTLPDEVHYLVRKAVIAMMTTEEYGESGFDDAVIQKVARQIRNSLNRGFQSSLGQTPIQAEYQDDNFRYYGYRI